MTEEKTYSGMNLCRESIGNYVMAFCKENGLGHELVDRSPSCKRVIFGKGSSSKTLFNFTPRELSSITQAKLLHKRLFRVLLKSFQK